MLKKSKYFFSSLFGRLLFAFLLLITIPLTIVGILSYKTSEKTINEQVSESYSKTIAQIDKSINIAIDEIISVINFYNQYEGLDELLNETYDDWFFREKNAQNVEKNILLVHTSSYDWLKLHFAIVCNNGNTYASDDTESLIDNSNIGEYDWYYNMVNKPDKIEWISTHKSYLEALCDTYMFTGVKALYDFDKTDIYASLLVSIEESCIYDLYKDSLEEYNEIFIIDPMGNIISHSNREMIGEKVDIVDYEQFVEDDSKTFDTVNFEGRNYLVNFKKVDKIDWYIIQKTPLNSILKDARVLSLKILIVSLVCIVLSFIIAVLLSRRISLPLINLTKQYQEYALPYNTGNPSYYKEIEILNVEYYNLVAKLNSTISNLLKQQEEKRHAELKALQMQINPHFLYNTLNSINCLVWTKRYEDIEPTVNSLITLLQQSILTKEELITIEEELNNVRTYLSIQEVRIPRVVSVKYIIDENLLKYKMPKLILQPVIENAIFHGIEPKKKGSIFISLGSLKNDIMIEITDDGAGMGKTDSESYGIGLKNVDGRLKLYFGEEYGIAVSSETGIGTSVTYKFPKILD